MKGYAKKLDATRAEFPVGSRIEAIQIDNSYISIAPGTRGVVTRVDPMGDLEVAWDNGARAKVVLMIDQVRKV